ncbi:MAG: 8-oxoguanine DNA glycosylase, N-terminal domain-containing protein, partial [Ruminococcus sp.]|nr:8-oxoguanine DNA glycosylase, N-terminal domain-containing protein [Ruminococcus sp.]
MNKLIFDNIHDLSLKDTLDCGQCFRWKEMDDGGFYGVVRGKAVTVSMDGERLIIDGAEEADRALWADYFDLGLDYSAVREHLASLHPVMADAARFAPGIRILRQEPFEALICFIISQNNNIKRITGIV